MQEMGKESNLQLSPLHLYTRAQPRQRPKVAERRGEQDFLQKKKKKRRARGKGKEIERTEANFVLTRVGSEAFSSVPGGDLRSAGKMAPAKSGEKASSFAMACSLLSRYVRQNGAAAGELGLGISAEVDAERTSADAEKGEAGKETMDLFPQNAGFGSEAAAQGASDAREQEKRQLTIFYGGKVLVFNDFPAEKAKDLMQMASKGASLVQNTVLLPSSTIATVTDSTKVSAMPAPPNVEVNAQKLVRPNAADIPQAPKASLRRFLEKRKDRITAKAPYQGSPSDDKPVKKELPESQPWLGLGPQIANPDLNLNRGCNQ